jgi:hypothetical protein
VRRSNCPEAVCRDCHKLPGGTHRREDVLAACAACHGKGREITLRGWQKGLEIRLAPLGNRLAAVGRRLAQRPDAPKEARDAYALAKSQIACVRSDGSGGAHNMRYALRILEQAAANLSRAEKLLAR